MWPNPPDPMSHGAEGPPAGFVQPPSKERIPERVARSAVWPLLLGGRANPIRQSEAMLGLEVGPLGGDEAGLRVRGELDVLSVLQLERALVEADLPLPFVLDLSGVTFMDGVGFSLLVKLAGLARGRSAVVLRNPSRSVLRILTIAAPDGIPGLEVQLVPPPV